MLQEPLKAIIDKADLEAGLASFNKYYHAEYRSLMLKKLGFKKLLSLTIKFLQESQVGYHQFFYEMARTFSPKWRDEPTLVLNNSDIVPGSGASEIFDDWCILYHKVLCDFDHVNMDTIAETLADHNPKTVLLRPVIESTWEAIAQEDNWQPFYELINKIQSSL